MLSKVFDEDLYAGLVSYDYVLMWVFFSVEQAFDDVGCYSIGPCTWPLSFLRF